MLGTRGCRLGILKPGLYRMQVRALIEAAVERKQAGGDPQVEIMIPLIVSEPELTLLDDGCARSPTRCFAEDRRRRVDYLVGTMIETPRAALVAGEIAEVAEFFSFGTNDLTQMTFGFSRDDVEGRFMPEYLEQKLLPANPFETLDVEGVGKLVRMAVEQRPGDAARSQARHLRRARRRPDVGARSATRSASTTCRARRTGCRSPAWPRRTPRSAPAAPAPPRDPLVTPRSGTLDSMTRTRRLTVGRTLGATMDGSSAGTSARAPGRRRVRRRAAARPARSARPSWPPRSRPARPARSAPAHRPAREEPDPYRLCFERDLDRIKHSRPWRRLAGKCQVFIAPEDDHLRTRLTHAVEVAQVAVGHRPGRQPLPPARRGDRARARLRARARRARVRGGVLALPARTGYDHAVYGADVTLAPLNLCVETLDGVRNHSWRRPAPATPEGEVVAWADRIAYVCHDFEDAVRAGILEPRRPARSRSRDVVGDRRVRAGRHVRRARCSTPSTAPARSG